jgi:hypothetical protein
MIDQDELWQKIDVYQGRACAAYIRALRYYVLERGSKPPDQNDADDWLQVPAIVYADVALTEKRLRHYLTSGTPSLRQYVFSNPDDALRILG